LRRLTAAEGEVPDLNNLVKMDDGVEMMASIEAGSGLEGTPLEPYALLARGKIAEAAELARQMPEGGERALRVAASSEGASPALVREALDLPVNDSNDYETTIAMYALALAAGRDGAAHAVQLEKQIGPMGPAVVSYLDAVHRDGDAAAAYANLPRGDIRVRLHSLRAAMLLFGEHAPRAWRREVLRGLFVGERGYVRPIT
jgi:hypothetical protein